MLRITVIDGAGPERTVKLEGRLVGLWIDELTRACNALLSAHVLPSFDLTDVLFIDDPGLVALRHLLTRGATINRCSPFVAEQLRGGLS